MTESADSHRLVHRAVMAIAVVATLVTAAFLVLHLLEPTSANPARQPAPALGTPTEDAGPNDRVLTGPFFFDVQTEDRTPLPLRLQRMPANNFRVSPDGTQLAFTTPSIIWVADVDGSHVRQVGPRESAGVYVPAVAMGVNWSPDGNHLVYSQGGQIFVVDPDTGRTAKLIDSNNYNPRDNVYNPNYSPDGSKILFTRFHHGRLALWTIPATGGSPELLLDHAAFGSYSPDGSTIAFRPLGGNDRDVAYLRDTSVFLADANGSHARPLDGSAGGGVHRFNIETLWPMWSPDGEWLAFEATYGESGTTVVNVATEELLPIPDAVYPSWLDNHTLIMLPTH